MAEIYRERGALRTARIGDAAVTLTTMREIVDIGLELVRADPGCLLTPESREYRERWEGCGPRSPGAAAP
jgi:hypothetical protein